MSYFGWESHKEYIPEGKELRLEYKLRRWKGSGKSDNSRTGNKIDRAEVDLNSYHI
jgi:hypothetical protein